MEKIWTSSIKRKQWTAKEKLLMSEEAKSALQSGEKKIRNESINVAKPNTFEPIKKQNRVSNRKIYQYGGRTCSPSVSGVNRDTIGWMN